MSNIENDVAEPPASRKRCAVKVTTREREAQCLRLRAQGLTLEQIGRKLGISTPGAQKCLDRALNRVTESMRDDAEQIKALEIQRLDNILKKMTRILDNTASTPEQRCAAAANILRVQDRRAKYLGLDFKPKDLPKPVSEDQLERRFWMPLLKNATAEQLMQLKTLVAALRAQAGMSEQTNEPAVSQPVVAVVIPAIAVQPECTAAAGRPAGSLPGAEVAP